MSGPRPWILLALTVVGLQLWGHTATHSPRGLILDDWCNFLASQSYDSVSNLLDATLRHGTRPVSMTYTWLMYRFFEDHVQAYFALSILAHLLLVLLVGSITWQLVRNKTATFLVCGMLALLPTLSELIYWPTMILSASSLALPLYLGCATAFLAYIRLGSRKWLALSIACYGLGVFSYEIGIFLPLAFLAASPQDPFRTRLTRCLAFAPVLLLYAMWRLTGSFGLSETHLPPHMQAGFSISTLLWNIKDFARWWIGQHMGATLVNGLNGFVQLPLQTQRWLTTGNLLLSLLAGWTFLRLAREENIAPPPRRCLAFWGTFWLAASFAPLAISYCGSRLMYLPACGLAWILTSLYHPRLRPALVLPIGMVTFLLLTVNQGTARQWQESGELQRRLFAHVCRTRPQWQNKEIVLFDTRSLNATSTTGLLATPDPYAHSFHNGNAGILRGFAQIAMLELAGRPAPRPISLLDAEHWPEVRDGQLVWHGRFDPTSTNITPMEQVYGIDVSAVVQSPPP